MEDRLIEGNLVWWGHYKCRATYTLQKPSRSGGNCPENWGCRCLSPLPPAEHLPAFPSPLVTARVPDRQAGGQVVLPEEGDLFCWGVRAAAVPSVPSGKLSQEEEIDGSGLKEVQSEHGSDGVNALFKWSGGSGRNIFSSNYFAS